MFFPSRIIPKKGANLLSLQSRLFLFLGAILLLISTSIGVMAWSTQSIEALISENIPSRVAAFQAAGALETALIHQQSFITYYLLDKNPEWLHSMEEYRQVFLKEVTGVEKRIHNSSQKQLLEEIRNNFDSYIKMKDEVIEHHIHENEEECEKTQSEIRILFFRIMQSCEVFKISQESSLNRLQKYIHQKIYQVRERTLFILLIAMGLILLLGLEISRQILRPLRRLAMETGATAIKGVNEITIVSRGVEGLLHNAGETSRELQRNQENLEQAGRMVMAARLATGTAHSIRNPLTSVKMRLFSLSRSHLLDSDQREDFEVISGEIQQIDTILQNFLEFSRVPKLNIQSICPSDVVDRTLTLLTHRLASYEVAVELNRKSILPCISGDPEQLKEVLVNLIENSCQAMSGGLGCITITEGMDCSNANCPMACIRLCDSGPGIHRDFLPRIFDPFVTTKKDGTGLGLSIAYRIIENHGGTLTATSELSKGACFEIRLPPIAQEQGEASWPTSSLLTTTPSFA